MRWLSLVGFGSFLTLAVNLLGLWALASGVTSGVKAVTYNCGTTYQVEQVLSGDWFCPEE